MDKGKVAKNSLAFGKEQSPIAKDRIPKVSHECNSLCYVMLMFLIQVLFDTNSGLTDLFSQPIYNIKNLKCS